MEQLNADFLNDEEMILLGINNGTARNIKIHKTAVIVWPQGLVLIDNIRIDPYVVISVPGLRLGRHVHISTASTLIGRSSIEMGNFSTLSVGCRIFSSNDDYSGAKMTNPTVPAGLTDVTHAPVALGDHTIVGANTVILPGTELAEGSAVGALSLVEGQLNPWTIYGGVPARPLKPRRKEAKELGMRFLHDQFKG